MVRSVHSSFSSVIRIVLLVSLLLTAPIVLVRSLGGFERSELDAYDTFFQKRAAERLDDRIVIVTIGDDDIEQLQQYPIHDDTFAQLLEKLERYQPRAIGLDISRDVPQGPAEGRKRLTQVIQNSTTIVSGCLLSQENYAGSPPAPGTTEDRVGFADIPQDADKTVRRVILVSTPAQPRTPPRTSHLCNRVKDANELPSFSFLLAQLYLDKAGIRPEPTAKNEIQLKQQVFSRIWSNFGGYAHTSTEDYQIMLNYRGARRVFREVAMTQVLQGRIDPQVLRDRVILIGSTSKVSKDTADTPYNETELGSRTMQGVIVHAHAVSQILSAVLNQRHLIQSWPTIIEILWIWSWALLSGLLAFYNRHLGLFLLLLGTIGLSLGLSGLCYGLFLVYGLWVPLVPNLLLVILVGFGVQLVDLANRGGYTQALYEQMMEQLQGRGSDRKGDYLERLVLRARALRQREEMTELLEEGNLSPTTSNPEMQALYEQIATKVRQDLAAEQAAQFLTQTKPRNSARQAGQIQSLLSRAQRLRGQPTASPNSHKPSTTPPENSP
jgi:CHASE2 domain-containing sensor protein